jgi:hypothetical protein
MSKQKEKQKKKNRERIAELEQKVDALAAALWEVTRLTLVSTSDRVPPQETPVALAGLAGIALKLQDGGLEEPETAPFSGHPG